MSDLGSDDCAVVQAAIDASDRLYVAGAQEVGAAVRTRRGQIFSAIHFESASAFATVCGEVAAIACMVAAGHRELDAVAAVWRSAEGRHFLLPPCGRCREVISDFNADAWVFVTASDDHWHPDAIRDVMKLRVSELLPRRYRGAAP